MSGASRRIIFPILIVCLVFGGMSVSAQQVETVDGVRVVHNPADGKWGKTPPVSLQSVRVIGGVDADDDNFAFNYPADLDVDAEGRLYVLDMQNNRVQVFSPDGKYSKTIGRQGQGPGEFNMLSSIALDAGGNLYVVDSNVSRIQAFAPDGTIIKTLRISEAGTGNIHLLSSGHISLTGSGTSQQREAEQKEELPALVKVIDGDGKLVREFGRGIDFGDSRVNDVANTNFSSWDASDNVWLVFPYQNRVEKYAADGRLLWRADRMLPYSMEIKGKAEIREGINGRGDTTGTVVMPNMNRCATGADVDAKGRLWVVALARQLRENEKVRTVLAITDINGKEVWSEKSEGGVDLRTTDAFKLEVFDPEGVLLGAIPIGIFVDYIYIKGDRLFLIDRVRGVQIHEFKIAE